MAWPKFRAWIACSLGLVSVSSAWAVPNDLYSGGVFDGYSQADFLQNPHIAILPSPRFSGGEMDGYAQADFLHNVQEPIYPSSRFSGGAWDGHAAAEFLQNVQMTFFPSPRFSGGKFDGYAHSKLLHGDDAGDSSSPRFSGGSFDGYAGNELRQTLAISGPHSPRFSGGILDGYAVANLINGDRLSGTISPRFYGGFYDGYGSLSITGQTIPLDLDTDGDGLPDWWELTYFGGITNAVPDGDFDMDGWDEESEYSADTNPNDPESYLAILRIVPTNSHFAVEWQGGVMAIQLLERSDSLTSQIWQVIHTNLPPTPIVNTKEDSTATNVTSFYRIKATRQL